MDTYQVRKGTALDFVVSLQDSMGDPITRYTGAEALSATVWPGGSRSPAFRPEAAWLLPIAGTITIAITAEQTAELSPGRYRGTLDLVDPAMGEVEAYAWAIDVQAGPGQGSAAPAYCSYPDLLRYGRGWLKVLQDDDDEAGFAAQCGRARSWLDDLIVAGWQGSGSLSLGDPGYGAVLTGQGSGQLPSAWLRQQLDAGKLIVRDLVVEVAAKKALGFICEDQVGPSEAAEGFARLGRRYHREANQLARTLRAELDVAGTGIAQFAVNLGQLSMRG